jgi:hypothetical protein
MHSEATMTIAIKDIMQLMPFRLSQY